MYLDSFKLDGRLKNIGEAKKRVKVFFDTLKQVIDENEKVIFILTGISIRFLWMQR